MSINRLYKILGYSGVLPFILLYIGMVTNNYILGSVFVIMQLAYGVLILSFLGGIHWPLAIKNSDHVRLLLSMLPTILGLLIVLMYAIGLGFYPFLFLSILFWAQFFFDKSYAAQDVWPDGYVAFRFRITCVASFILFLTAVSFL